MISMTARSHFEKAFAVEQVAKQKTEQTSIQLMPSPKQIAKLNVEELNNPFTIEGHLYKGLYIVK